MGIALLSALAGLLQAGVLLVIVQAGAILTSSGDVAGGLGPLSFDNWSVSRLLVFGTFMAIVLLATEMAITYMSAHIAARSLTEVRSGVMLAYSDAPWGAQATFAPGTLEQLLTNHCGRVADLSLVVARGIAALMNFVTLLVAALIVSPLAAFLVSIGLGVILLLLTPIRTLTKKAAARAAVVNTSFAVGISERASLAKEVHVFGVGPEYEARLRQLGDETIKIGFRLNMLGRTSSVIFRLGTMFLVLMILAIVKTMSSADFTSTIAAVLVLVRAMSFGQSVQDSVQSIHETIPWIDALYDNMDKLARSDGFIRGTKVPTATGLTFNNVSFAYKDGVNALTDIDVELGDRSAIGIIGPSGAGKSTFIDLALRLRQPNSGSITYGDVLLDEVDWSWWHANVALVPQDSVLFSGTVEDNIAFLRSTDHAAIVESARSAELVRDVDIWPNGLQTQVGHRGSQVSGGQRQRISIARSVLGTPRIVALDEPTSALDPETEALVSQAIGELARDALVLVVAHRLSTVRACDRLMVIEGGRLTAFGPPELVRQTNEYCQRAFEIGTL